MTSQRDCGSTPPSFRSSAEACPCVSGTQELFSKTQMVFLHFHLFLLFALGVVQCAEEYTCNEAQSIVVETTQCQSVTWLVGRLVDQANSTGSEYGPMVLPIAEQERRVTVLFRSVAYVIGAIQSVHKGSVIVFLLQTRPFGLRLCRGVSAVSLCLSVYAPLRLLSIDTMYWPVCRSECEAVQNKCGAIPNLNCSQFQDNAYECSRLLSSVSTAFRVNSSLNSKFRSGVAMNPPFPSICSPPSSPSPSSHGGRCSSSATTRRAPRCTPSSPCFCA